VTPLLTLPHGYSEYHTTCSGTIPLMAGTDRDVLEEIVASVTEYGAAWLAFVDCRGGDR